jgi:tetratricopeptide (TPR) repeat protein/TolB-like protein
MGPDANAATLTKFTQLGTILGTFGYMAPEQLRGEVADSRSDLFAVGAVLYEMLSGRPAFPGSTPAEQIATTLTANPPPLDSGPPELNAVILRALAKERDHRYSSAREFLVDLVGAAEGQAVSGLPNTLGILDFANLSGNARDAWIGTAMIETLGSDLGRSGLIRIVPRAAVLRAQAGSGHEGDPLRIGLLLGCRWILKGSFQRVGPALRLLMSVLEVGTGRTLVTEKIDGSKDGLFTIQDRLAEIVNTALSAEGFVPPRAGRVKPDLDAYECHARGREEWLSMKKSRFENAEDYFQRAIDREPGYADALVGLAMVHNMRFTFTTDAAELDQAAAFAGRAIAAAPSHGEAHIWLAYALWRQGQLSKGHEAAQRAAVLDPHSGYPPYFSACMLMQIGRTQEALALYQKAVDLLPEFGFAWLGLGSAHMEVGSLRESLWCLRKAVGIEASAKHATAGASGYVAECLRRAGKLDEARAEALEGIEAAERTDHMYRDTFRAICLCTLGRVVMDQADPAAARAAFRQAETHLRGRARTLGGGFLLCQALAGLGAAEGDSAPLKEAVDLFEHRGSMNWSWFWLCANDTTASDLSRAARHLDRPDLALRIDTQLRSRDQTIN